MREQIMTIQALEIKLGQLAAKWRGNSNDPVLQAEIVQQYHAVVQHLYEFGWDDVIDIESELPERLMPKTYLEHNPPFYSDNVNWIVQKRDDK